MSWSGSDIPDEELTRRTGLTPGCYTVPSSAVSYEYDYRTGVKYNIDWTQAERCNVEWSGPTYDYNINHGGVGMADYSGTQGRVGTVDIDELIDRKYKKRDKINAEIRDLLEKKKLADRSKLEQKLAQCAHGTVISFSVTRRGTTYTYGAIKLFGTGTGVERWYLTHSTQYMKSPMTNGVLADFVGDNTVSRYCGQVEL